VRLEVGVWCTLLTRLFGLSNSVDQECHCCAHLSSRWWTAGWRAYHITYGITLGFEQLLQFWSPTNGVYSGINVRKVLFHGLLAGVLFSSAQMVNSCSTVRITPFCTFLTVLTVTAQPPTQGLKPLEARAAIHRYSPLFLIKREQKPRIIPY